MTQNTNQFGDRAQRLYEETEAILREAGLSSDRKQEIRASRGDLALQLLPVMAGEITRLEGEVAKVTGWHAGCGDIREGWDNMAEFLEQKGLQQDFEEWARETGRIKAVKAS
jgi:hypothetical protein